MKIGFVIKYFYPYRGGAEDVVYYLAKEIAKEHEVHIFTSDTYKGNQKILKKDEEIGKNLYVHRCKFIYTPSYHLAFSPELLTKILNTKLDILHFFSLGFLWNDVVALLKKRKSRTKIILTPHARYMTLNAYTTIQRFFGSIIKFIERILLSFKPYDAITRTNKYQKWIREEIIKPKFGKSDYQIFDLDWGIPDKNIKKINPFDFIKKYNLDNKFIISYVGRVQKYKGLDQIIKILPNLHDTIFVVAGPFDDAYEDLKKLIKKLNVENKVLFLGFIPEEEKLKLLSASSVFVLPSEWESFGIAQLEAMAQGNVIIATDTEGSKHLIEPVVNGFLYKFGDLNSLEKYIKIVQLDKTLRDEIAKNNIEKAKKEFLWSKKAEKLKEIIKDLQQEPIKHTN